MSNFRGSCCDYIDNLAKIDVYTDRINAITKDKTKFYTQLAEEAAELSAIASKKVRQLTGDITEREDYYINEKIIEETADVKNCLKILEDDIDFQKVAEIQAIKMKRWLKRLTEPAEE